MDNENENEVTPQSLRRNFQSDSVDYKKNLRISYAMDGIHDEISRE